MCFFTVRILKEDGGEARVNELGRVVCKLPMPPGTLSTLYKGWNQVKYEKDLNIWGEKVCTHFPCWIINDKNWFVGFISHTFKSAASNYTYDRATNFFKNTSMAQNCLNHQERQKICCTLKSSSNISHYFESTANSCTAEVLAQSLYGKNVSFVLISFLF